jgi:hypothetical protein
MGYKLARKLQIAQVRDFFLGLLEVFAGLECC